MYAAAPRITPAFVAATLSVGEFDRLTFDCSSPNAFAKPKSKTFTLPGKPRPLIQTPADESAPRFSPDGRWIAYVSDASGRPGIYAQPYPPSGEKWQISTSGGREPVWAPNGAELFYRLGDKLMVAEIKIRPAFAAAKPHVLFEGSYEGPLSSRANFDISSDGRRFLMLQAPQREASAEIKIVPNWFEEVRRRAPSR